MGKFKEWFDRNWNLLFYKKRCVKLTFQVNVYKYNDMIMTKNDIMRCLGNDWYKIMKKINMEKEELKLSSLLVTLGTDIKAKFAWCLREVNGEHCVCLHERNDGRTKFSDTDFITAMPLKNILSIAKMRGLV